MMREHESTGHGDRAQPHPVGLVAAEQRRHRAERRVGGPVEVTGEHEHGERQRGGDRGPVGDLELDAAQGARPLPE
jgi:hypothetical protein